jgi:hypothetical protein
MTLRDKIAKALFDIHRRGQHPRQRKPGWSQVDKIEKDAWRQDADAVLRVIKRDRLDRIAELEEQRVRRCSIDIYGDR